MLTMTEKELIHYLESVGFKRNVIEYYTFYGDGFDLGVGGKDLIKHFEEDKNSVKYIISQYFERCKKVEKSIKNQFNLFINILQKVNTIKDI